MNALGLLWSKFHIVLSTRVVWYVVEIMLTKIHPKLHKRIANHGGNCAVRPPAKTARQNLGVGNFRV
jgi:hypothetical protein